jgi:flagellar operon protein
VNRIDGALKPSAVANTHGEQRTGTIDGQEFGRLLDGLTSAAGLRFSKHALQRISSRGISLDSRAMEKLDAAVMAAMDKGSQESLVLMDELALIVSVKNRTVITAMSSQETKGNVFTSIDSTVIA